MVLQHHGLQLQLPQRLLVIKLTQVLVHLMYHQELRLNALQAQVQDILGLIPIRYHWKTIQVLRG